MKQPNDDLIGLALAVVEVLDRRRKARTKTLQNVTFNGFESENTVDIERDIENLINKARRILQKHLP